jgi:hypothetical protein
MASKKVLSGEVVIDLLEQMLESQEHARHEQDLFRQELLTSQQQIGQKLDEVVTEQRGTNERLDRLERTVVGIGRMSSLEARVQRLEERVGVEPPRD